ncbi:MAG: translocation/assembly module TamB domain-containing protein [Deltaproteobacteria bacterium]|nr:translocation/assembly module TamB domain-containing protein [Deltaproteobacteria bacterium]
MLIGALLAAATLWFGSLPLLRWARQWGERELAGVFHAPCQVGDVSISWWPTTLTVSDFRIGRDAPILAVRSATVQLRLTQSLRRLRPVATLRAAGVFLDIDGLPKGSAPGGDTRPGAAAKPVAFEVTATSIEDVTVQFPIDRQPLQATAPLVNGRVGISPEQPFITMTIDAGAAALRRAERQLSVSAVHMEAGVLGKEFYLHKATIAGEQVSLSVVNQALPPATRHHLTAELPFELLAVVFEPLKQAAGRLSVEASCTGELFDSEIEAQASLGGAVFGGLPVGEVKGTVLRRGKLLAARDVTISAWQGTATASLELTVAGPVPATGSVTWQGLDAAWINRPGGPLQPWSFRSDGSAQLTGTLEPVALSLEGAGALAAGTGESAAAPAQWTARLGISRDDLQLTGTIEQAAGNRAQVSASLTGGEATSGRATLHLADVAKLAPLVPTPLRETLAGSLSADVTLSGTLAEPRLSGALAGDRLTVLGATLASLRGQLEWSDSLLTARALQLTSATGSGQLDGVLALTGVATNDWQLQLQDFDWSLVTAAAAALGHELPLHGGTATGAVSCRGPWHTPALAASLDLQRLWVLREPLAMLALRAAATPPDWQAEVIVTHARSESLKVTAAGRGRQPWRADIESSRWQLGNLRGAGLRGLEGTATLRGHLEGPLPQLGGRLQLEGQTLVIGGRPLGPITVNAEGEAGQWQAQTTALDGAIELAATLATAREWPFTLHGRWQLADAAPLIARDGLLRVETAGSLRLAGGLSSPADLGGELLVPVLNVERQAYRVQATEPIVVRGEHGRFRISSCSLAGEGSRLQLAGEITTAGVAELRVEGGGNLALLELVALPVKSALGEFAVAADAQRSAAGTWQLRGSASLQDAALDVGAPLVFTNTNGRATLAGSRIRIEQLEGKAGGGGFGVSGAVDVNRGPEVSWTIDQVALTLAEGLEARLSGHGSAGGPWAALRLDGSVEIVDALYDRDLQLTDLFPWLKEQILPAPRKEAATRKVEWDLRVYAHDGLFIDNNVAKVEMWTDLHLTGSNDRPVVEGTIGVLNGEVPFRGHTFTITGGAVDFRDRFALNPNLNINAETHVATADADYTVTVAVTGTAEHPRVQFSADDPNLSQNDVLSLVSFGKTTAQLQREGGGVSATDVLALLPTRAVEQRVSRLVGVDRFEIEAAQARTTGAIEPRVTIGKDLTERLRAVASGSFGVEARRSVQLEYRLTRRISLLGSWESQTQAQAGAFGGDVKFRYEFRRLPLSLMPAGGASGAADER